ncbi:MAG: DUF5131 family protein, partial [Dehalococcoidales bacterium]|nr:DUF5131 family protein [Dehalococcoidales bacterium]
MIKRLSRTGIEYGDLGWNFYPGCLHKPQGICPVPKCWAEGMSKRQRRDFHKPHLVLELLLAPLSVKKPSVILVNFMGDLFGDWVNPEQVVYPPAEVGLVSHFPEAPREKIHRGATLRELVIETVELCPQHQFLFLTKAPWNLPAWSPFSDNCFVGVSATSQAMHNGAIACLSGIQAKVKYISYEPLLEEVVAKYAYDLSEIQWVIIGQQTPVKKATTPKIEWVREIVEAADKAGVKVFLKNNLLELVNYESPETAFAFNKEGFY